MSESSNKKKRREEKYNFNQLQTSAKPESKQQQIKLTLGIMNNQVVIQFGQVVNQIVLDPVGATQLAKGLIETAGKIRPLIIKPTMRVPKDIIH